MGKTYLIDLRRARASAGTKAAMLRLLHRYGCAVPPGVCCTFEAWDAFVRRDPGLLPALRSALAEHLDSSLAYAVRSSADAEDQLDSSFAGQFTTLLDVHGVDEIVRAVTAVWESARSESVSAYGRKIRKGETGVRMGVVIQRMVRAEVSGVAFSRNPMTGLDEVVVEAVRGRGDSLVQQGVTPDRWVFKWGTWAARPEESSVSESLIREIATGTRRIEKRFGRPVDLEWAHDGTHLFWLQLREITSLRDLHVYSEKIAREMLPGMIKPLIWSVNIPLVNGAWVTILTELIGKNSLDPRALSRQFYYRAYFDMGTLGEIFALLGLPRESLELLMGIDVEGADKPRFRPGLRTLRHVPRMLRFFWDKWHIGPDVERFVVEMRRAYGAYREEELGHKSPEELLEAIDRLFALNQRTAYYNIIAPLMMQMHHRSFKGALKRGGVDYEQLDLAGGCQEVADLDPNAALARAHAAFERLPMPLQRAVRDAPYDRFLEMEGIDELKREVTGILREFGHLSNIGVDFSATPWRETPELVVRMAAGFTPPAGSTATKARFEDLPLSGLRKVRLRRLYARARRFLVYRARVGGLYTLGYGLFRRYFLALADVCVRRGVIAEREDVFYLTHEELRAIVHEGSSPESRGEVVRRRRAEMETFRDAEVPPVIYGETAPPLHSRGGDALRGVPTSRGYYTGPVCVIRGIQEYERLNDGDVLVIPFSDVGLTPLFARAGAVVAESGGILSHSSIIAREYGIPAVVSVPGACRLADGTRVAVDGYTGDVRILGGTAGEGDNTPPA